MGRIANAEATAAGGPPGQQGEPGRIDDAIWTAAGFRWWGGGHLKDGQVGLWQRRVEDDEGTLYFVTVFVWDWRMFRQGGVERDWSYEQSNDLTRGDLHFHVQRVVKGPEDATTFAAEIWSKMGCDRVSGDG